MEYLGTKWSSWSAIAASNPKALHDTRSAKSVRTVLSTATQRRPQQVLAGIVKDKIPTLLSSSSSLFSSQKKDERGEGTLSSSSNDSSNAAAGPQLLVALLQYGTKTTVTELAPLIVDEAFSDREKINSKKQDSSKGSNTGDLSKDIISVLTAILHRSGCAPEAEERIEAAVLRDLKQAKSKPCSALFAGGESWRLIPPLLSTRPHLLTEEQTDHKRGLAALLTSKEWTHGTELSRLMVEESVTAGTNEQVCEYLWSSFPTLRRKASLCAEIAARGPVLIVNELASSATLSLAQNSCSSDTLKPLSAVIRRADEAEAKKLAEVLVRHVPSVTKGSSARDQAMAAALLRFPSLESNSSAAAASATKWNRSHVANTDRVRQVIASKIRHIQKRPRIDDDEF